jgi:hypothetical protein
VVTHFGDDAVAVVEGRAVPRVYMKLLPVYLCLPSAFRMLPALVQNRDQVAVAAQFGAVRAAAAAGIPLVGTRFCSSVCTAVDEAAKHGHWDVAAAAHEAGCPWSAHTTSFAAEAGHLEVLQRLHEAGCPWNGTTTNGSSILTVSLCHRCLSPA